MNFCNYKNYLINGTFSTPVIKSNTFKQYKDNQVLGWNFNNGIILNNSIIWGYPIPYPCGTQVCSIQGKNSISQTFSVPKTGIYSLNIYYVSRKCCDKSGNGNTLNILLNGIYIQHIINPITDKWILQVIELNLTKTLNNKIEIIGTAITDRSTAIQLVLTNQIQSKSSSSILKINEKLNINKTKYSDNKEYYMTLKQDGLLCVYNKYKNEIWNSGKKGKFKPYAIFQTDGNLCIYNNIFNKQTKIWCSMSSGSNRTYISLDNDGIIRIWNNINQVIWSSTNKLKNDFIEIPKEKIIVYPDLEESQQVLHQDLQKELSQEELILKNIEINYDILSVPVYVIGDYGIKPWGKNNNFPDSFAKWIWYTDKSNINSPNNIKTPITIQYIYSNKTNNYINCNLNIIIDNSCEVFLNSQILKKNNGNILAEGGWNKGENTWNIFVCKIQPGNNLFEFKVKNAGNTEGNKNLGSPAGLIVCATILNENIKTKNSNVLFYTNEMWKFIPIPIKLIQSCNLSQKGLITTIDKSFPWGCLSLNGTSSQYVDIGKTITGMKGLSFGCWFRSNKNKDNTKIFDFGNDQNYNNISLFIHDNKLGIDVLLTNKSLNTNTKNLSQNINDNTWHHIVWTLQPTSNGSNYIIYLDNNMISSTIGSYPINTERTNCYLGKSNSNNNSYFIGNISNFVFYQKILSPKEINALYYSMINLFDPSLYIYLPFSTNSVLDILLNNYANKTFSLPITKSNIKNQNWTCIEEENNKWIGVKMENNKPICMSMDGKKCIQETKQECAKLILNPIVPHNPIICNGSQMNWCVNANKQLSTTISESSNLLGITNENNNLLGITDENIISIKPYIKALSALETNIEEKYIHNKDLLYNGQILSLKNSNDINLLMIGGTFKLRVNLPMTPPYIKGKEFDITKGLDPNYFYLSIEKLDNNCEIINNNNKCIKTFADNKKCNIKALTSEIETNSNSFRLVLVAAHYVLDSSIPIGKNSDFTLVKINNQLYLKNIQTGYLPSLYSNDSTISVYGDMEIKSNSNVNKVYSQLNNILCNQEIPPIETTGTNFIKCDIKRDSETYLITSKNIGSSSPIRININNDKTICLNLLSFNKFGYPTDIYAITSCNYNIKTFDYIEKMTNKLGTFMVNMVCFEKNNIQNNKTNLKKQLKFNVELINFPPDFIKDNSVFDIN
jgi:hypothetical protein